MISVETLKGTWGRLLVSGLLALAAAPGAVWAQAGGQVNEVYGSYSNSVPIEVPKNHGIEPQLSLVYNSSGGNGLAGVGWGLNGFSVITRTALGGSGTPFYNASDEFLLDGQRLMPCTALGGTHCTRIQNYTRISYNAAANTWSVTGNNGTVAFYTAVYNTTRGTYRWGISSITDTHGNTTGYGWSFDGNDSYPSAVAYKSTTIMLYREARPDPISFANGSSLGISNFRLKSIDIKVGDIRARAYKLVYSSSAVTGQSLLASVQQFGRDATLDASGTVIGGTALPATTFYYNTDGGGWAAPQSQGGLHGVGGAGMWFTDINGDGKADYVTKNNDGTIHWNLSTGNGWAAPQSQGGLHGVGGAGKWFTDINGDGKADYVTKNNDGTIHWNLSTGNGWAAPQSQGGLHGVGGAGMWLTDIEGDGRADYVTKNNDGTIHWNRFTFGDNLLNTFRNGLGGTSTIAYTPSTAWLNTNLPFPVYAVTSVSNYDGRGASSTANYSYARGLWSASERTFLGFGYVRSVIDAAGNYTETYYRQTVGNIGKPDVTYFRNAGGAVYKYTSMTYAENTSAPYTSLLTQRWDYQCELQRLSNCVRTLAQFGYDEFANLIEIQSYGDVDRLGDETTKLRGYAANRSAHIVSRPAYENTYAGIGTTGALLKQTLYLYDGAASYATQPTKGVLTGQDTWNNQTGGYQATRFGSDARGNLSATTDPRGMTRTVQYDTLSYSFPLRECNALAQCASTEWDPVLGVKLSATDPNGAQTTYSYDVLGRPLTVRKADGSTVTFSYLSWGDPNQQRLRRTVSDGTADGLWTETYYDGLQRIYRVVREGGASQDTLYNSTAERKWKQSSWYNPGAGETARYTVYAYDALGRVRTATAPDGAMAESQYAASTGSRSVIQIDENRNAKWVYKDAQGRTTATTQMSNATGQFSTSVSNYDLLGRLIDTSASASAIGTTYTWNSLGQKVSECLPDIGCLQYTYDAASNLASSLDAAGRRVVFAYDSEGRLTQRVTTLGKLSSTVTWAYDEPGRGAGIGHITTMRDDTGSQSHSYDSLGRQSALTKCVLNLCYNSSQRWDLANRLASETYPDGEVVNYLYDTVGRLQSIPGLVTQMTYSSNDQLLSSTYANGAKDSFAYDPNRLWLTSAAVTSSSNATLYQKNYQYDAGARVRGSSSTLSSLDTIAYDYDFINRLTSIAGPNETKTFAYDAVGNITRQAPNGRLLASDEYFYANPSRPHAVTSAQGNTYTYDAVGNMLTGAGRTLTWNAENQLASVTRDKDYANFHYDGMGERVSKKGSRGSFHYFGPRFEVAIDRPAPVQTKYYYAGPRRIASQTSGIKSFYHQDRLGSVVAMTDASGGQILAATYSAYGTTLAKTGSASSSANFFGFTGHRSGDDEAGLIYMNARYYDPALARFISPDTVVPGRDNPQGLNRYAYGFNNPISHIDPTGHAPVVIVAAIIVGTGAVASIVTGDPSYFLTSLSALTLNPVAMFGAVVGMAGIATENAVLISIGAVMTGYGVGVSANIFGAYSGLIGGSVAALTSPISPLDPELKQSIGYAYLVVAVTAKVYQTVSQDFPGALGGPSDASASGLGEAKPLTVDQQLQLANDGAGATVAGHFNAPPAGHHGPVMMSRAAQDYGNIISYQSGGALSTIDALRMNPCGGMVGPGCGMLSRFLTAITPTGSSLYNHAVMHDAFGFLKTTYGVGPGYLYAGPLFIPESPVAGQVTGWVFNTGNSNALTVMQGLR